MENSVVEKLIDNDSKKRTALISTPLTNLTYQEISKLILSFGGSSYWSELLWKEVYCNALFDINNLDGFPSHLTNKIKENFTISAIKEFSKEISKDGTEKYLLTLVDDLKIEAVLIPDKNRNTLCISSQVGCRFGCAFCATGKMGFNRNLTTAEIISQLLLIQKESNCTVTNIVYMGMGEPFDNYENVIKSASIFSDDKGVAIPSKKITISTVGLIPGIQRYIDEKQKYQLAISLHSAFDKTRSQIMPANKKNQLDSLFVLLKKQSAQSKKKILFEYLLLNDINDSDTDAKKVIEMLSLLPSKLNLIKYHENEFSPFTYSGDKKRDLFYNIVNKSNFPVMFRTSRGEDIAGACGQLKGQKKSLTCR